MVVSDVYKNVYEIDLLLIHKSCDNYLVLLLDNCIMLEAEKL